MGSGGGVTNKKCNLFCTPVVCIRSQLQNLGFYGYINHSCDGGPSDIYGFISRSCGNSLQRLKFCHKSAGALSFRHNLIHKSYS